MLFGKISLNDSLSNRNSSKCKTFHGIYKTKTNEENNHEHLLAFEQKITPYLEMYCRNFAAVLLACSLPKLDCNVKRSTSSRNIDKSIQSPTMGGNLQLWKIDQLYVII